MQKPFAGVDAHPESMSKPVKATAITARARIIPSPACFAARRLNNRAGLVRRARRQNFYKDYWAK
jgi:hypothetical protein